MKNIFVTVFALIAGFMALVTSLVLAIPLAIAALITGKRIQNKMKQQGYATSYAGSQYSNTQYTNNANSDAIEGEYEDLSNKK
ncbi:hypothetical protein EK599_09615 [Vibrio sp. T187]|uniref:hypothetical protein n=1 Tax=Vibrio TaxID=662 RepID=UPI0010C9B8D4|nr:MULTISPECIES: hypothetical protein [Vibrio]MBW3695953.1 hypothetical protein [Vibrio sp. T187]